MKDNLKKLIDLAKADGGKFFVIDEHGNPTLVIMSVEEYQKVLIRKLQNQVEDIDEVNRKLAEAKVQEELVRHKNAQEQLKSEVIDSTFSFEPQQNRAQFEDF